MKFGITKDQIIFNADDEFPSCNQCSNFEWCNGKNCGPEYFWARYVRIVNSEEVLKNVSEKL